MKKILCTTLIFIFSVGTTTVLANENINKWIIQENENSIEEIQTRAQYAFVQANNVNFRSAPGLSSTIYRQVHKGYMLTLCTEHSNDYVYKDGYYWRGVIYNGIHGYVAVNYLDSY